ncbi:hypothetical protein ACNKHW_22380 [Shigella flexneri]
MIDELTGYSAARYPLFETDGRLVAKLTLKNRRSSIIAVLMGELVIAISTVLGHTTAKPRPKLEGDVESRQLRLAGPGTVDWR